MDKLPGSLWLNGGRWNWRVRLPGAARRQNYPLRRPGGDIALAEGEGKAIAEAIAWGLWREAEHGALPARKRGKRLSGWIGEYCCWAAKYYRHADGRPTTQVGQVERVLSALADECGECRPADVGADVLRGLVAGWVNDDLSRTTINKYLHVIRRLYRWLLQMGAVDAYSEAAVARFPGLPANRSAARETTPVMPVSLDAVEAVLPRLTSVQREMLLVQYICDMRPGEVCMMTPGQIDTSDEIWLYEPRHHKTLHRGKVRVIAILPEAREIVERRMQGKGQDEALFSPRESYLEYLEGRHSRRRTPAGQGNGRKANPMIHAGDFWTTASYGGCIRRVSKAAGQPFTVNQLRHTRATENRALVGAKIAAVLLGHAEGSRVTDRYTHTSLRDEAREEARQQVKNAAKLLSRSQRAH